MTFDQTMQDPQFSPDNVHQSGMNIRPPFLKKYKCIELKVYLLIAIGEVILSIQFGRLLSIYSCTLERLHYYLYRIRMQ